MGNSQSQSSPRPRSRHDHNGPLFGGHYPGDFSIRGNNVDTNKPLPPLPPQQSKNVRFGSDPPAWVFYKDRPTDENLGNTRYCSPPSTYAELQQRSPQSPHGRNNMSPPPAYGTWDEKGFTVRNQ